MPTSSIEQTRWWVLAATWAVVLGACAIEVDTDSPTDGLSAAVVVNRTALEDARRFLQEETEFDAFIALQGDAEVMRWGDANLPINTHSVRKSLLSALFGIAEARGLIQLDRTLASLGIDEPARPLTETERSATIDDLLKSRSGVYLRAAGETRSMRDGRPSRGQHRPGEAFYYNNWDFNVLGVIFEQETGLSIGAALEAWIAKPTGMTSFQANHVIYASVADSRHRQFIIYMSAADLARFGALYVQDGQWAGTPIIPPDWIRRSFTPWSTVTEPKPFGGYGYMWWLDEDAGTAWADGWRGQYMIVDPARRLVVVSRNDTGRNLFKITWVRLFGRDGYRDHHQQLHAYMLTALGSG